MQFLYVFVALEAVQIILGNFVEPLIMGKGTNLGPISVVISLAFWGMIWGGIGAFLAVPMMVVAMIICAEIAPLRPIAILFSGDGKLLGIEER